LTKVPAIKPENYFWWSSMAH